MAPVNPLLKCGDHLIARRFGYTHHGLYLGDGNVLEYLQHDGVKIVDIEAFAHGHEIFIREHHNARYSGMEAVQRGMMRLGENHYNLLTRNCEHFVNWCIDGVENSRQVDNLILTIIPFYSIFQKSDFLKGCLKIVFDDPSALDQALARINAQEERARDPQLRAREISEDFFGTSRNGIVNLATLITTASQLSSEYAQWAQRKHNGITSLLASSLSFSADAINNISNKLGIRFYTSSLDNDFNPAMAVAGAGATANRHAPGYAAAHGSVDAALQAAAEASAAHSYPALTAAPAGSGPGLSAPAATTDGQTDRLNSDRLTASACPATDNPGFETRSSSLTGSDAAQGSESAPAGALTHFSYASDRDTLLTSAGISRLARSLEKVPADMAAHGIKKADKTIRDSIKVINLVSDFFHRSRSNDPDEIQPHHESLPGPSHVRGSPHSTSAAAAAPAAVASDSQEPAAGAPAAAQTVAEPDPSSFTSASAYFNSRARAQQASEVRRAQSTTQEGQGSSPCPWDNQLPHIHIKLMPEMFVAAFRHIDAANEKLSRRHARAHADMPAGLDHSATAGLNSHTASDITACARSMFSSQMAADAAAAAVAARAHGNTSGTGSATVSDWPGDLATDCSPYSPQCTTDTAEQRNSQSLNQGTAQDSTCSSASSAAAAAAGATCAAGAAAEAAAAGTTGQTTRDSRNLSLNDMAVKVISQVQTELARDIRRHNQASGTDRSAPRQ
ncbi:MULTISPECIES: lecithin retinol acyltransferase family protein [unclassified Anaerobiospirillum]|uniref:lecithin retinol acyltransferase family protein n=1 Tax=unclassified Anaerobiospirillum TaxID=2647410 RepID=UPI001FF58C95|nr:MULTISPECIES: lecithin retinol acyltransferase family protein [unclassified Anaerobiospirillum]MCK0535644.1 lecithin retinol acyltransferase family protein [Anaerobiospirillum sp. NML120511]MCK0540796.1 lecithin retinol acyltransferase family protein [Anaerobiospirillum sp. NML02-A-032]